MTSTPLFDYISSAAVSITMAGNTGISPFFTLLILGIVEMANPELLNMGETMELLFASWWSIILFGVLALGELVGKCIPAIDEMIDSAEVFVIPIISVLTTLATMGMLPTPVQDDVGQGEQIDAISMLDGGLRSLQDEAVSDNMNDAGDLDSNGFGAGFMMFTKVLLVFLGIAISLMIHFFKMIVRVSSLVCSGGCCQPCITVLEYVVVVFGVVCAILAPVFAIIASIGLFFAAAYIIRIKCCKNKEDGDDNNDKGIDNNDKGIESNEKMTKTGASDVENRGLPEAKVVAVTLGDEELVDIPMPPPVAPKADIEASAY